MRQIIWSYLVWHTKFHHVSNVSQNIALVLISASSIISLRALRSVVICKTSFSWAGVKYFTDTLNCSSALIFGQTARFSRGVQLHIKRRSTRRVNNARPIAKFPVKLLAPVFLKPHDGRELSSIQLSRFNSAYNPIQRTLRSPINKT